MRSRLVEAEPDPAAGGGHTPAGGGASLPMRSSVLPTPAAARRAPAARPDQAFERLFQAEYPRVVAVAQRVLGEWSAAEDVAQEVFLAFHRRHPGGLAHAAAWLHVGAVHTALNRVRAEQRRLRRESAHLRGGEIDLGRDPADAVVAAETRGEVRRALSRLPRRRAAVLALRYSGLSYAEVAAALGVRVGQVGTRLRRAEAAFLQEVTRGSVPPPV